MGANSFQPYAARVSAEDQMSGAWRETGSRSVSGIRQARESHFGIIFAPQACRKENLGC